MSLHSAPQSTEPILPASRCQGSDASPSWVNLWETLMNGTEFLQVLSAW